MAFALLMTGIILLVSAVRNTQDYVVDMLRQDFTGQGNFLFWVIAIIVIGALGYVESLKKVSDGLLVLLLLALFLTKGSPSLPGGGFFKQFQDAIKKTTAAVSSGGPVQLQVPNIAIGGG